MRALLLPAGLLAAYLASRDGLFSPRGSEPPPPPAAPTPLPPGVHLVPQAESDPAARILSSPKLSVSYCVS
jgi:hypothetical protein